MRDQMEVVFPSEKGGKIIIPTLTKSWRELLVSSKSKELAIPWQLSMQLFPMFCCSLLSLSIVSSVYTYVVWITMSWITERSMQFWSSILSSSGWSIANTTGVFKAEIIYLSAVRGHWVMKISKAYLMSYNKKVWEL